MESCTNTVKFYYKIQSDIIKDLPRRTRVYFGETEEEAFILVGGCSVFVIPKEFSILNIERLKTKYYELKSNFLDSFKQVEYKPAVMTGYTISPNGDEFATLVNGDLTVYVNKELLKLIPKKATYGIISDEQLVKVKLGEEVIAYICPTHLSKQ